MADQQDTGQHSLFSAEGAGRAAELLRRQQALERRRRRLLVRVGLPLLLLLLLASGWLLRRPIRAILTYQPIDYAALQLEQSEALEREQSAAPTAAQLDEADKATQVYGNPEARLVITMRFESEFMSPEGLIALAQDAVASKPSEICLRLAFRPPLAGEAEAGELAVNGERTAFVPETSGGRREVVLVPHMREEDFAAVLDAMHAEIYGRVAQPLRVALPESLQERRRRQAEAALPAVVPKHQAETAAAEAAEGRQPALVLPDLKVTLE